MTSPGGIDAAAELDRLVAELERCLGEVIGVALVAADHPTMWAAMVSTTTGAPREGLPWVGGAANGAEVRAVLIAVARRFGHRLGILEQLGPFSDALEDRIWTFRNRRLDGFVKQELATYLARIAPKPSVSSVFAAAAQRAQARAAPIEPTGTSVQILLCNTCGAPRLADVLYSNCAFCGHAFFPTPSPS